MYKIIIYCQRKNYISPFKYNKTVSFSKSENDGTSFISPVIRSFAPGNFAEKCILKQSKLSSFLVTVVP